MAEAGAPAEAVEGGNRAQSERMVLVHPLLLLNVADHWTRSEEDGGIVAGALVGFQTGRDVDLTNSFELVCKADGDGSVSMDVDFLQSQFALFGAVYPNLQLLGWYAVTREVEVQHLELHKEFMKHCENPLFLTCAPDVDEDAKDLPVAVHEALAQQGKGGPSFSLVALPFHIETGEAERVSVDHVAKLAPTGAEGEPGLNPQLQGLSNAIAHLHNRVHALVHYVEAVKKGEAPHDHALLRKISALCSQLPSMDPVHLQREMERDANDVALLATLSALTKQAEAMNHVVERTTVGYGDAFKRATQGPSAASDYSLGMGDREGMMGWMGGPGGYLSAGRGPSSRRRAGSRRGPGTR